MQTPEKLLKTLNSKIPAKPRKRKCPKQATVGDKSLSFFDLACKEDEENGEESGGILKFYYDCKLCGKRINGKNLCNLGSHLFTTHREIYVEHIGDVEESIPVERLRLLQNCVSMVALNGRPFTALTDFGFQEILKKQLNKFEKARHPLDLKSSSQPTVHKHLHETATLVRSEIKKIIKNRPLSVLLDIGTRLKRSILGVSVQLVNGSNVQTYSIGMIELNDQHTAINLAKIIRELFQEYGIQKRQVISITTDNGRNVLKMIKDLKEILSNDLINQKSSSVSVELFPDGCSEGSADDDIILVLSRPEITDDSEAIDLIFNGIDLDILPEDETLLQATVAELITEHEIDDIFNMSGINCVVHTLQLAVKYALNMLPEEFQRIISLCRRIAKILNTKRAKYDLNSAGITFKIPRLETETRWGSMFGMVSTQYHYTNVNKLELYSFLSNDK